MRMIFRYEDGTEYVTTDKTEGDCIHNADALTEVCGDIVYYSEIENDSFLYEADGIQ